MCTKSEAMSILQEVYERSKNIFGSSLSCAYLYGSYARGDYDDESDVDILLTVDQSNEAIRTYRKLLLGIDSALSLEHNVTVCVTDKPLEQFENYADISPFYRNVIKEEIRYAGQ